MKKYLLIFSLFLGVLFLISSCAKEDTEPQMDLNNITAPVMAAPADGMDYILTKETADSLFARFEWSAATYPLDRLPESLYAIECAESGTDFADVYELGSTTELFVDVIQSTVNNAIIYFIGENFDSTAVSLQFRIKSTINANNVSEATVSYSAAIMLDVTPYATSVTAPALYLIGDGTTTGWDNNNTNLQFSFNEETEVYTIIAELLGPGLFFKAFEVPGQWAPQWGTDATGTAEGGPLVYRPTEDVPDPAAIPTPETAGNYLITFDLVNKVYSVEEAVLPAGMHIIGDATEAGWDNTQAIPMEEVSAGKFQLVANLNASASEGFKFLVNQGAWAPMYGTVEGAAFEGGVLVYRETEADPDPKSIPPPPSTGAYLIEMDIIEMIYTVTPQ